MKDTIITEFGTAKINNGYYQISSAKGLIWEEYSKQEV